MKRYAAALVAWLLTSSTAGATALCLRPLEYVFLNTQSGQVMVNLGFGVWVLCHVSTTANGVSPETCRAMYASLLSAKTSGQRVGFYFDDGQANVNVAVRTT